MADTDIFDALTPSGSNPESVFDSAFSSLDEPKVESNYNPFQLIGQRFNLGAKQVEQARYSLDLLNRPDMDGQSLKNAWAQGPIKSALDPSADQAYESSPFYLRAVADAAGMLPGIGDTIAQGVAGGAITAGGALLGAGPLVAEVPILGPIIGELGFSQGYTAGNVLSIWEQSAGEMAGTLIQAGVRKDVARNLAFTFGSMNAGLEFVGFHTIQKFAGNALSLGHKESISRLMQSAPVRKIQTDTLARLGLGYAEEVLTESGTEGVQQFNSELAKMTAALIEKKSPDTYTNWDTAITSSQTAFLQALGASAVLGAASGIGGSTIGAATGATKTAFNPTKQQAADVLNNLKGVSPTEILARVNATLKEEPYAFEHEPAQKIVMNTQGQLVAQITKTAEEAAAQTPEQTAGAQAAAVFGPAPVLPPAIQELVPEVKKAAEELSPEMKAAFDAILPPDEVPLESPEGRVITPTEKPAQLSAFETQARMNQISADISAISNEESRIVSDIKGREGRGQSTENLVKKLNSIYHTRENLHAEARLLESGLLTREDVTGQSGKVKMEKLAGLFRQLDKEKARVLKTREKSFAAGQKSEQKAISSLQDQLEQIVRASTTDPEIRKDLRAEINKVTTLKQFDRASAKIEARVSDLLAKKQEADVNREKSAIQEKVVKLLAQKIIRQQSGHPVSKFSAEATAAFQKFKEFIREPAAADKEISGFIDKHGEDFANNNIENIPSEDLVNYQIANQVQNMTSKTPQELAAVHEIIAGLIQSGRAEIEAKKAALSAEKVAIVGIASDSLGLVTDSETFYTPTPGITRKHFMDSLNSQILTADNLWRFITPTDKNHKLAELLDVFKSRRKYLSSKDVITAMLHQSLQKTLNDSGQGRINILEKITEDSNTLYSVTFQDSSGKNKSYVFTKAKMIDIWMKLQDKTLHPTMQNTKKGNGWTFPGQVEEGKSFVEVLEKFLQPEDKAVAKGMLQFYQDYYPKVNDWHREKYGVDLPNRENYSPLSRAGYDIKPSVSIRNFLISSRIPGSAKTRQNSLLRIEPENPYTVAEDYIDQWEYARSYDQTLLNMNAVFSDPDIKRHIENTFGSGTMQVIKDFQKRFVDNNPMPSGKVNEFWAAVRADISRSALGFRVLSSMATQLTSGTSMWKDHSVTDIGMGAIQATLHPVETEKAFRSSAILRERFKTGPAEEFKQAFSKQGLAATTLSKFTGIDFAGMDPKAYDLLNRMMFKGITAGDAMSVRMFGAPVYWAERNKGASHDEAMLVVERLAETTQQGSDVSQLPYVISQNPTMYTLLGMFRNQPLQLFGHSMIAIRDFENSKKTPGDFMALGKQLGVLWIVPGLALGAVKALPSLVSPPGDNEDRDRETLYDVASNALLGPMSGIPVFGDILEALWFSAAKPLFGVDKSAMADVLGRNPLVTTLYNNPTSAVSAWNQVLKFDDPTKLSAFGSQEKQNEKVTKALLKTGRAVGGLLGLPVELSTAPTLIMDSLKKGDFTGAAFALGGWSAGSIRQRQATGGENPFLLNVGKEKPMSAVDAAWHFAQGYLQHHDTKDTSAEQTPDEVFAEGFLNGTMEK